MQSRGCRAVAAAADLQLVFFMCSVNSSEFPLVFFPRLPPALPDKHCSEESAACLVTSHGSFNMGVPTKELELLSSDRYVSGLQLSESDQK